MGAKHCHCCHTDYTAEQWAALPLLGFGDVIDEPGDELHGKRLEFRDCACKSTLGVWVQIPDTGVST